MAIVQVLIGLALRSLGRVANTALGWATAPIRHTVVAFEEWEVLFREFLLVERRLRLESLRGEDVPGIRRAG